MSVMWTQGRRERGLGNERVKGDREEYCEDERGR